MCCIHCNHTIKWFYNVKNVKNQGPGAARGPKGSPLQVPRAGQGVKKRCFLWFFYVVNNVIHDKCILCNASMYYDKRNQYNNTKKHTFLGYLEALAGPCPGGPGRPVLGPSQKVPKIALFRAIIALYTLICNHYIDRVMQLHTIELRAPSVHRYISVLKPFLCPFPRGPQGAALEGF